MSAFQVSSKTYDAIFTFLLQKGIGKGFSIRIPSIQHLTLENRIKLTYDNEEGINKIIKILIDQNIASVNFRYNEKSETLAHEFKKYDKILNAVEILKLLDCYEYQSCETPNYRDSEACRIIDKIRSYATGYLDGYDKAAWALE